MSIETHERFMREALKEAAKAYEANEVPVGAVLVCNNRIISRAHNQTELLTDVTAHAEIIAMTGASNAIGAKYLPDCTLYVTLEPCVMCAGASYWSQIGQIVIGARDEKRGFNRLTESVLHPKTNVIWDILATDCSQIMTQFFSELREKKG